MALLVPAGAQLWACCVEGLEANTHYYYRFLLEIDGETVGSRIGRTKTAPDPSSDVPVRFAVVSCQAATIEQVTAAGANGGGEATARAAASAALEREQQQHQMIARQSEQLGATIDTYFQVVFCFSSVLKGFVIF